MSNRRAPGEPGRYQPIMAHQCGYDGGDSSAPTCGQPATHHLWGGAPPDIQHDWVMLACEKHLNAAIKMAWDWHPISAICNVPGTLWQARGIQGKGFCYWPEAEAAMHEAVTEGVAV